MLDRAAAGDPGGWFRTAANVGNRWRVCGLAATYTMLQAIGPARGRLLNYKQAIDERRTCCVSFASMVFHAVEAPSTTDRGRCRNSHLTRRRHPIPPISNPVDNRAPLRLDFVRKRPATTSRPRSAAGMAPDTG